MYIQSLTLFSCNKRFLITYNTGRLEILKLLKIDLLNTKQFSKLFSYSVYIMIHGITQHVYLYLKKKLYQLISQQLQINIQ